MRLVLALALALPVSAQTVTRVSVSSTGEEGNGPTTAVTISESGRWVAMPMPTPISSRRWPGLART
jgi:hypothetical protein